MIENRWKKMDALIKKKKKRKHSAWNNKEQYRDQYHQPKKKRNKRKQCKVKKIIIQTSISNIFFLFSFLRDRQSFHKYLKVRPMRNYGQKIPPPRPRYSTKPRRFPKYDPSRDTDSGENTTHFKHIIFIPQRPPSPARLLRS